jgi:hypothetical protein
MTETEGHESLGDELEGQANELQEKSTGLEQEIGDVKQDWERKRADEGVPGAVPPHDDTERDEPGDEVNPEDADRGEPENEPEDAAGKDSGLDD